MPERDTEETRSGILAWSDGSLHVYRTSDRSAYRWRYVCIECGESISSVVSGLRESALNEYGAFLGLSHTKLIDHMLRAERSTMASRGLVLADSFCEAMASRFNIARVPSTVVSAIRSGRSATRPQDSTRNFIDLDRIEEALCEISGDRREAIRVTLDRWRWIVDNLQRGAVSSWAHGESTYTSER